MENLQRIKAAQRQHFKKTVAMEDIINSVEKETIEFSYRKKRTGRLAHFLDRWEKRWFCHIKPQYKALLSIFLGFLSILVFVSEITLFMNTKFTLFGIPLILSSNFFVIEVFMLIPLFYMAFSVYYGMFRIKIAGYYGLYSDNQTDGASLLFTSVNFSRVTAPLCFNFLNLLRVSKLPAFNKVMGKVED